MTLHTERPTAVPPRPAVVMFVRNDCSSDTRVLREAATLAAAGHPVTIMATTRPGAPATVERVERNGITIIRVPIPGGWRTTWRRLRTPWRAWASLRHRLGGPVPTGQSDALDWLASWRFANLAWGRAAAATAPAARIHHGHDLTGLPAALASRRRAGGLVVYDSHELFLESGSNARRPRWAKRVLGRLERRWSAEAAALVTVNATLDGELRERLGFRRSVVVHNCPPRWDPPLPRPDHLRHAAGIPPESPVVLYHGGFGPDRGLLQLAAAMREPGLEGAHLVYLGFGALEGTLRGIAADPASRGRIHVVPSVPPEELDEWVASADVGVMPNQPITANERLSTPNKLFESLAAGLPVVTSDFPERHRIVLDDPDGPLGAVCNPEDPASIGRAIRSILDLPPDELARLRERCLHAAHARWNWETESARLLGLYEELSAEVEADRAEA